MLADTLLIDGVDLRSVPGIIIGDLAGLISPLRRRGSNLVLPGRPGVIGVPKVFDAYAFDVPITVLGESPTGTSAATLAARRDQMHENLYALAALFPDGLVTLTRRYRNATDTANIDHTCNGEYVDGLAVALLNPHTGRTALQFVNLDGYWSDGDGDPVLP